MALTERPLWNTAFLEQVLKKLEFYREGTVDYFTTSTLSLWPSQSLDISLERCELTHLFA
jgi:hypothetical protein